MVNPYLPPNEAEVEPGELEAETVDDEQDPPNEWWNIHPIDWGFRFIWAMFIIGGVIAALQSIFQFR